jgi:lipopolysaccharide export system protein LptC
MNQLAAISEFDHAGTQVFAGVGRSDERVFRAAVRHSRRVRVLRLAIPIGVAVAVLGVLVATTWLKPFRVLAKMPIDIGHLVVSGTKITMQQPRLAGFTKDNRHYDLTAQAAAQDLTKPDVIELQGIRANVEMQDNISYETTALNGVYNSRTEMLILQNNVVVTSSDGNRARLSEAVIDIRGGKMISEKPVEVKGLEWTLSGNRVEITEGGAVIRFDRGVTMTLMPARNAARADGERRTR